MKINVLILLHLFVRQTFCQMPRPESRRMAIGQRVAVDQKGVGLRPSKAPHKIVAPDLPQS